MLPGASLGQSAWEGRRMLAALRDVFLPTTTTKKGKTLPAGAREKWPDPDPLAARAERAGWGTRAAGENYNSQKAVRARDPSSFPPI